MIRTLSLTTILIALAAATPASAQKQRIASYDANGNSGNLDAMIARHAAANNIPEDLVRRVIKRESGGRAHVVSAGNYGLMQIKLPTARSMGYTGTAAGLLDADTNMTYAVSISPAHIAWPVGLRAARCTTMPPDIITPQRPRACRSASRTRRRRRLPQPRR